jgi:hypothetical protein
MGAVADAREPIRVVSALQRVSDAEIRRILRRAARDLTIQIENLSGDGFGRAIREAQLRLASEEITRQMWASLGDNVNAAKSAAIDRAAKLGGQQLAELLAALPENARRLLLEGAEKAAGLAVDRALARAGGTERFELSQRVYRNWQLSRGAVDRLIVSGLARGLTARELAREARRYILPTAPGGASFSAFRLARTEINNSFHAMSVNYWRDNPFVDEMDWNLSRSHPKADECDSLAANSPYDTAEVPSKPHPQCFCYVTPSEVDERTVLNRLNNGSFDAWLQRQGVRL